jgi:hypothetical protein
MNPIILPCPCCSSTRIGYSVGDRSVRMNDRVECLDCGIEMDADHDPGSALNKWNTRPVGASWKVFLDDLRETPEGWIRAYWPEDVIELLNSTNVVELSLDHDLGDDSHGTGYDVLLWIEEQVICHDFIPPKIKVHSANSSARMKMHAAIISIEAHAKPLRNSESSQIRPA